MGEFGEKVIMKSWMILGRVHKIAKSDYQLSRVSLTAWNNSAATGRIEYFSKFCPEYSSLVENEQE